MKTQNNTPTIPNTRNPRPVATNGKNRVEGRGTLILWPVGGAMAGGGKKINEPTDADNAAQRFYKKIIHTETVTNISIYEYLTSNNEKMVLI